jgi:hypothetical protein
MRFFIPDLLERLTDQSGKGPFSPFHGESVSGDAAAGFPQHFSGEGEPWHLALDRPLNDDCAREIAEGGRLRRRFETWLSSKGGLDFHAAWSGWGGLKKGRAQTTRLKAREASEEARDGLRVIYFFASGGALYFPELDGGGNRLFVEPAFNRVLLFRTRGAPYGAERGAPAQTVSVLYPLNRQAASASSRANP